MLPITSREAILSPVPSNSVLGSSNEHIWLITVECNLISFNGDGSCHELAGQSHMAACWSFCTRCLPLRFYSSHHEWRHWPGMAIPLLPTQCSNTSSLLFCFSCYPLWKTMSFILQLSSN
jgi:hypothetical protein